MPTRRGRALISIDPTTTITLAAGDIGDVVGVIALLIFTLLGWLGKRVKDRQNRSKMEAEDTGSVHEMDWHEIDLVEGSEPAGEQRPPPIAKPLQVGGPRTERAPRREDRLATRRPRRPEAPPLPQPPRPPPIVRVVTKAEVAAAPEEPAPPERPQPAEVPKRPEPPRREAIPSYVIAKDSRGGQRSPIGNLPLDLSQSPAVLRRAVVMAEILAAPVGLRDLPGHERGMHV